MFPYLTIVRRAEDESLPEARDRAALIAACILSSHVKPLQTQGQCDHVLSCLRHYVIVVDTGDLGFSIFEAKLGTDGGSGYLLSRLDSGQLSQDSERFEVWLHRIHQWATDIWKPTMMDAFSPQYLEFSNREMKAGLAGEARLAESVWACDMSTSAAI